MKNRNYFVLFGPPGAGKGTQSNIISERLDLPRVATGEIFRENLGNRTPLGQLAAQYLQRGELVPDEVTIRMVKEYLESPLYSQGALLDGFPRTTLQAEALAEMVEGFQGRLAVAFIEVPEEELIERLAGRWTCRAHGHTFHIPFYPPQVPGVCDHDGSELYQREDDQPATVARRIKVYYDQTMPLLKYYDKKGLLVVVDGSLEIEQVAADLLAALAIDE